MATHTPAMPSFASNAMSALSHWFSALLVAMTLSPDSLRQQQRKQIAIEYALPEYVELGWNDLALVRDAVRQMHAS